MRKLAVSVSFFLHGCAGTGDQREPESHAERRVRPGAEAARSGGLGEPQPAFRNSQKDILKHCWPTLLDAIDNLCDFSCLKVKDFVRFLTLRIKDCFFCLLSYTTP